MEKNKYYLGIYLGTSSVKGVLLKKNGEIIKIKRAYEGSLPNAWLDAVKRLAEECRSLVGDEIAALAISSQVGTYVVNGRNVIPWSSDVGIEELKYIKSVITEDEFISGIHHR